NLRAHQVYMLLEPEDVIARHEWLFKKQWVEESYDELEEEELDFTARSAKIELLRQQALTAIWSEQGLAGVLDLASRGECATLIGSMLTSIFSDNPKLLKLGIDIIELGPLADSKVHQFVISGFLYGLIRADKAKLIEQLISGRDIQ